MNNKDWFTFTTTTKTLNQLLKENPTLFYSTWFGDEKFANDKGEPRTLAIRTSAIPESFDKTWKEQQELIKKDETVPTARDLVEGIFDYYKETGKRLFAKGFVRTSDVSLGGFRISVGNFDSDGLGIVHSYWDGHCHPHLGLAVAKELNNG